MRNLFNRTNGLEAWGRSHNYAHLMLTEPGPGATGTAPRQAHAYRIRIRYRI